jgi:hypothetical protein
MYQPRLECNLRDLSGEAFSEIQRHKLPGLIGHRKRLKEAWRLCTVGFSLLADGAVSHVILDSLLESRPSKELLHLTTGDCKAGVAADSTVMYVGENLLDFLWAWPTYSINYMV